MKTRTTQKKETQIMTVREVAEYLRLSQAKVYRLAKAGSLPAMQIGTSWRFRRDLIDQWFLACIQGQGNESHQ